MTYRPCAVGGVSAIVFPVLVACGGGSDRVDPIPLIPAPTVPPTVTPAEHGFAEIALRSGLDREFGIVNVRRTFGEEFASGLAAADYDADGDVDLYVAGGDAEPNHLYRNQGDGTFVEVAAEVGLALQHRGSGPTFADIDGDDDLDLFIGGIDGARVHLMENRDGSFVDITSASGLEISADNTISATFGDYDLDGDLDLVLAHWGNPQQPDTETLWRNDGRGVFESVSIESGIAGALIERDPQVLDRTFTPNFSDIDNDGDPDLLITGDFDTSQIFENNGDGTFRRITDRRVIVDEAGMGAAVGDYDNDGDMDWFVTSIHEDGGFFGNRLYRNLGDGTFEDATEDAGVARGGWGWGSCFADFDNDGVLDIFHTNGWKGGTGSEGTKIGSFQDDQVRLFMGQGDGTFRRRDSTFALNDKGMGRGVACFDAERDGDIDIVIVNNDETQLVYYRNDMENDNHYLGIVLDGVGANTRSVGAWITVDSASGTQVREVRAGNNYVSQNPTEVHFGLGPDTTAEVTVRWPNGTTSTVANVQADQLLAIEQPPPIGVRLVVARGSGGGNYAEGDRVAIKASPADPNYHFSHWTSDGGGSFDDARSPETTFVVPGNPATVIAHYTPGVAMTEDVSVARRWSEVLLQAIRNDYARPTVHARNLFHVSAAMYDVWAAFDDTAEPWLLGGERAGVACEVEAPTVNDVETARRQAMSFAAYRIIRHRFTLSPRASLIRRDADALLAALGYDMDSDDGTTTFGNGIGQCYIDFGLADGANEADDYANVSYEPVNPPLEPGKPGNPDIVDLNRWQPLKLEAFIDQAGNPVTEDPEFLSPEWGIVVPFALSAADRTVYRRDDFDYWVYHDPGMPPTIDGTLGDDYRWSHALVAIWSSHLDPADGVTMDISPASLGNIDAYPARFEDHRTFYDAKDGGDPGTGYEFNPTTGEPYAPQVVPRGDYTRVLAEFWADGPDSETPPGHWFVILNEVNEHPLLARRFEGTGDELGALEWDAKAYFALGGAMHDAAIAAWGVKGYYDYIRPISSLRAMADRGQSSDADADAYHADGIPLTDGIVELVEAGDELAGEDGEHVGKIKFHAWRGPDYIEDEETDTAGVGWILAENWWPYQRPTFVTPPFAGYVSGHSTYSRAAAEVLTALTGDAYFPGGMSGFEIKANEFLVFEDGPSVDMTLQWATYRDASDQCSLSRIWGGIHPPIDDIPGRLMGIEIGRDAFALAAAYFRGESTAGGSESTSRAP
ncbi:MAG: FG-GAP-like repeat-containing protein [Gammaproteobacteria bacterium]|nr:FG-GAP-like repeat-containing protein [Gammaproteobacteria bacterium]